MHVYIVQFKHFSKLAWDKQSLTILQKREKTFFIRLNMLF